MIANVKGLSDAADIFEDHTDAGPAQEQICYLAQASILLESGIGSSYLLPPPLLLLLHVEGCAAIAAAAYAVCTIS